MVIADHRPQLKFSPHHDDRTCVVDAHVHTHFEEIDVRLEPEGREVR
jgi:hypothetical protein